MSGVRHRTRTGFAAAGHSCWRTPGSASRRVESVARARAPPVRGKGRSHLDRFTRPNRRDDLFRPEPSGRRALREGGIVVHHELPARLDLEWYRKQAKSLVRGWRAGEGETVARIEEVLGERAHERFRLSDAQWVIAREHGFRSWAAFARWVETREPDPPVGRIGRKPVSAYEERAR